MTEFYVKVEPGGEEFDIDTSGTYPRVCVESAASQGRANTELVARLSEVLGRSVRLVSGHRSGRKKMAVDLPEERINEILSDYPG